VADQDGEERFTEADLEPSADELAARRRGLIDRVAAAVAALCAGTLFGGLVALGACAAPMVFTLAPPPFNGNAMGAAFARWDRVAVVASALLLACEMVRTWAGRRRSRAILPRVRRVAAVLVALSAVYIGANLSPRINELHREGVRRGEGEQGAELDAIHNRAELVGKVESALALGLVILHVLTIRSRDDEDDEEYDAPAPLPPGPR
jgi:hypothetical protein